MKNFQQTVKQKRVKLDKLKHAYALSKKSSIKKFEIPDPCHFYKCWIKVEACKLKAQTRQLKIPR